MNMAVRNLYQRKEIELTQADRYRLAAMASTPKPQATISKTTPVAHEVGASLSLSATQAQGADAISQAESSSSTGPVRELNAMKNEVAMHRFFRANNLYKKFRDIHNHLHRYTQDGRLESGKVVMPTAKEVFKEHIRHMDDLNIKQSVVMPIPLELINTSQMHDHTHEDEELARMLSRYKELADPDNLTNASEDTQASTESKRHVKDFLHSAWKAVSKTEKQKALDEQADKIMANPAFIRRFQGEPSCCGADPLTYYMDPAKIQEGKDPAPDMPSLAYNSEIDHIMASVYEKLSRKEKKRLQLMVTGVDPSNDNSWRHIHSLLSMHKGVFSGIGEFTVHKEFVYAGVIGRKPALQQKGLDYIFKYCGQIGIPATLHCDVDDMPEFGYLVEKKNRTPEEQKKLDEGKAAQSKISAKWEELKTVWRNNRGTKIIHAHTGLGRFVEARMDHIHQMEAVLDDPTLSHVMFDISWTKVAKYANQSEVAISCLANLMAKHPDRFAFGSDFLPPAGGEPPANEHGKEKDPHKDYNHGSMLPPASAGTKAENYRLYHNLRARINEKENGPAIVDMIFNKNYKAIFEIAEANRDSWERAGCPLMEADFRGLYRPGEKSHGTNPFLVGAPKVEQTEAFKRSDRAKELAQVKPSKREKAKYDVSHPVNTAKSLRDKLTSRLSIPSKKGMLPSVDGRAGTYKVIAKPVSDLELMEVDGRYVDIKKDGKKTGEQQWKPGILNKIRDEVVAEVGGEKEFQKIKDQLLKEDNRPLEESEALEDKRISLLAKYAEQVTKINTAFAQRAELRRRTESPGGEASSSSIEVARG